MQKFPIKIVTAEETIRLNLINLARSNGLFGKQEIGTREKLKREVWEKEAFSLVWRSRETGEKDEILMGPTLLWFSSSLRRKRRESINISFFPILPFSRSPIKLRKWYPLYNIIVIEWVLKLFFFFQRTEAYLYMLVLNELMRNTTNLVQ